MKSLHNVKYTMDLGCNFDVWRIHGLRDNGEPIFISTPTKFENGVITTVSGSQYKIESYEMNCEEFTKYIREDIERGSFLVK